ncbi:MAG: hypothetical protein AAFY12_17455 [Pseudomonadota bacterium]
MSSAEQFQLSLRASGARPGAQRLAEGEYSTAFRLSAALGRNDEGGSAHH